MNFYQFYLISGTTRTKERKLPRIFSQPLRVKLFAGLEIVSPNAERGGIPCRNRSGCLSKSHLLGYEVFNSFAVWRTLRFAKEKTRDRVRRRCNLHAIRGGAREISRFSRRFAAFNALLPPAASGNDRPSDLVRDLSHDARIYRRSACVSRSLLFIDGRRWQTRSDSLNRARKGRYAPAGIFIANRCGVFFSGQRRFKPLCDRSGINRIVFFRFIVSLIHYRSALQCFTWNYFPTIRIAEFQFFALQLWKRIITIAERIFGTWNFCLEILMKSMWWMINYCLVLVFLEISDNNGFSIFPWKKKKWGNIVTIRVVFSPRNLYNLWQEGVRFGIRAQSTRYRKRPTGISGWRPIVFRVFCLVPRSLTLIFYSFSNTRTAMQFSL